MGHEDRAVDLPPNTTLLASSDLVENQAYRFDDAPIYCTQFHPELTRDDLIARVRSYPEYVARIAHMTVDEFCAEVPETPEAHTLLRRFVTMVFDV
jgi:GMP synthase (glutamine-hydrolysing)